MSASRFLARDGDGLGAEITAATVAVRSLQRRRKATAVHKASVLCVSDGLHLEACAVARDPQLTYEARIVDAMAALSIRDADPRRH